MYIQDDSLSMVISMFSCNNEFIQGLIVGLLKYYILKKHINSIINLLRFAVDTTYWECPV